MKTEIVSALFIAVPLIPSMVFGMLEEFVKIFLNVPSGLGKKKNLNEFKWYFYSLSAIISRY